MMIKNKVRNLREKLDYTQADLAEHTNLSIRTIQRVESGQTIPKGHTLKVLAAALGVDKVELKQSSSKKETLESVEDYHLKLMNLSSLCFIGIPFGNLLVPFWIWKNHKEQFQVDGVGRRILNFQIIWTLCTCLALIISPFLQVFMPWDFALILWVGLFAALVNVFFILKNANALMQEEYDIYPLKLRLF